MGKKSRLSHVEFRTRDLKRLQAFYDSLFGWKFKPHGDSGYTMIDFGNDEVQGGVAVVVGDSPLQQGASQFFTVDDIEVAEKRIKELGGRVLVPKQPAGEFGWMSYFVDPDQNVVALWQEMPKKLRKEKKRAARKANKATEASGASKEHGRSVIEIKSSTPIAQSAERDNKEKKTKKEKKKEKAKEGTKAHPTI